MADDSEDKPSISKNFTNTTAAVLDTFNRLKKWREEQIQEFRSRQLQESQKFSNESKKNFERVLEIATKSPEKVQNLFSKNCNLSSISERDYSDCYDGLQDSSITGHLQRCFDDSSQSSLSVTSNKINFEDQQSCRSTTSTELQSNKSVEKNPVGHNDQMEKEEISKSSSAKPKRPFLKKGSGLLRYMPKSAANRQPIRSKLTQKSINSPKRNTHIAQKILELKPAIRGTTTSSDSVKHIRFDIPNNINESNNEPIINCNTPTVPKSSPTTKGSGNGDKSSYSPLNSSSSPEYYFPKSNKSQDSLNSVNENASLSEEKKELEEFEMLESCAQNSSFNSDSSVVQRVLHGERAKPSIPRHNAYPPSKNVNIGYISKEAGEKPTGNSIFPANIGLSKCQEEIQTRKQILQKVISDINPRIQSLQKEISNFRDENLDDSDISERCSTPIEDLLENKISPRASSDHNSNEQSLEFLAVDAASNADEDLCNSDCKTCNFNGVHEDSISDQNTFEEQDSACDISDLPAQCKGDSANGKSKIQEKLMELEKEIKIYEEHNAKLASICKERNDIMRKLQKERENFEKYKESEKKKLEAEMEEERRQIRRQKESFTRYQKLRRDNPTRKEREELSALRQEVEKLQEELKRQKIKYTNDSRRWKNQIDAAEKERDTFKLENIKLEEQVQDLLSALKSRMKKKNNETNSAIQHDKTDEDAAISVKGPSENKDGENNIEAEQPEMDSTKDSDVTTSKTFVDKKAKQKVRFNLEEEGKRNLDNASAHLDKNIENFPDNITSPLELACEDINHNKNVPTENDGIAANLSIISVSVESEFKEIDHGNKIERIYPSGEREIIFPSGTRKIIKADGVSFKFLFYNGDSKEIFPDKHEVYRYVSGVTETHFPDGLEVTEFPNGQIQRRYADGQKEVKFPDGTVHNIYPDSSEEIRSADGNIINLSKDGIETIEFANGQREIRTATYRRREFPDGSVKIIYDSGRQETRYSNGRIRIKDKDGKVIVDTKYAVLSKG